MLEIIHNVEHSKEGTYYTIPFTVPDGVEKITVSYEYQRGAKGLMGDLHPTNVIDIGLADEKGRFLGWSGSAHSKISVGEFSSSNGYLCEKINPGEWKIIIGAYHVLETGVQVKYSVDFEMKAEKLLLGDLHIHSDASDGKFDTYTLGKMAQKAGLDFIGIANHNNFAENFCLPHQDGLTFIKAVEWTHYKGHMNFFGVNAPFENSFIANSRDEMHKIISDARSMGAVISVNHPKCRFCPYLWEDENAFDMMEIWNGPMRPSNLDAVIWWTELLRAGRKIPIVGGSDYHRPHSLARLANPVTAVLSPSKSADDILNSIKNGRSFVTNGVDGPKLDVRYGEATLGETVRRGSAEKLIIAAENLGNAEIITVNDCGEEKAARKSGEDSVFEVNPGSSSFIYVKAIKGKGKLRRICAITNPIYFE